MVVLFIESCSLAVGEWEYFQGSALNLYSCCVGIESTIPTMNCIGMYEGVFFFRLETANIS